MRKNAAYKIGISVEELCVNTARYAAGSKSDMIDIFLNITPEAVILKVRDNGKIFNPTEYINDSGETHKRNQFKDRVQPRYRV